MPRRACADCLDVCDREDYSKNQWRKGVGESRCTWCVEGVDKPVRRTCAACARLISIDDYSNNQWYKGPGVSRCRWCVQGVEAPTSSRRQKSARENDSFAATFEAHYVFAEGAFRYVYEGEYTVGRRRGEKCVVKMFKNNSEVYEASFFEMDIKAVDKALHIIEQWNAMGFIDKSLQIQLNVPRVWAQSEGYLKGKKVLVEPFIHNWQKFNSNSCEGEDDYTSHAKHHRVKRCAAGAASLLLSTPCRARALTSTHAYTLPISRSASIVIRRVVIRRVFFVNGTQRSSRTARRYVAR
mmetsp:Transcript_34349/g.108244  ORF Transcript_34349/g.108244 Transcript_34349/m.108244 type:complete len:296 (-) Transcript_34349:136-1023(-)